MVKVNTAVTEPSGFLEYCQSKNGCNLTLWFQALSIETEEDIHLLASYFMHLKGKPDQGEEEKVSLLF